MAAIVLIIMNVLNLLNWELRWGAPTLTHVDAYYLKILLYVLEQYRLVAVESGRGDSDLVPPASEEVELAINHFGRGTMGQADPNMLTSLQEMHKKLEARPECGLAMLSSTAAPETGSAGVG